MRRADINLVSVKAAGLWLRCFLGGALVLGAVMGTGGLAPLQAMTCVSQPRIHIKQVRGTVDDPSGVVVPGAVIRVMKDGQVVMETQSDATGVFAFNIAPGDYEILAVKSGFWNTSQPIRVENTLGTRFRSGRLLWILGFWGTTCGICTSDGRLFKSEIAAFSERLKKAH